MDPHYHSVSNMSLHVQRSSTKSQILHYFFVTLDVTRDSFFFLFLSFQRWELRSVNNQKIKKWKLLHIFHRCQVGGENSKQRGKNEFTPDCAALKAVFSAGFNMHYFNLHEFKEIHGRLCCITTLC